MFEQFMKINALKFHVSEMSLSIKGYFKSIIV